MRNKCQHKKAVKLVETLILDTRWMWCLNCGATRLDKTIPQKKFWCLVETAWKNGKWKSPKIALNIPGQHNWSCT